MSKLSAEQWDAVNDLALWIHGQRNTSKLQEGVLKRLSSMIPHKGSFFDLCYEHEGRLMFFDPISISISDEDLSYYYQRYELSDYVAWCFNSDEPVIYRDSDMVSDEAREKSLIYREWMQPLDLYYSIGCTVVHRGVIFGSITLFSAFGSEDFTETDMQMLREINRHLSVHCSLLWPEGVFPDGFNEDIDLLANEAQLSKREKEVMRLVVEGQTNKEIGNNLFISESTVKKHVNTLYRKIGVDNRVQLMRLVYRRAAY